MQNQTSVVGCALVVCGIVGAQPLHGSPATDSVVQLQLRSPSGGRSIDAVVIQVDHDRVYMLTTADGLANHSATAYPRSYPAISIDSLEFIDAQLDVAVVSGRSSRPPPPIAVDDGERVAVQKVAACHGKSCRIAGQPLRNLLRRVFPRVAARHRSLQCPPSGCYTVPAPMVRPTAPIAGSTLNQCPGVVCEIPPRPPAGSSLPSAGVPVRPAPAPIPVRAAPPPPPPVDLSAYVTRDELAGYATNAALAEGLATAEAEIAKLNQQSLDALQQYAKTSHVNDRLGEYAKADQLAETRHELDSEISKTRSGFESRISNVSASVDSRLSIAIAAIKELRSNQGNWIDSLRKLIPASTLQKALVALGLSSPMAWAAVKIFPMLLRRRRRRKKKAAGGPSDDRPFETAQADSSGETGGMTGGIESKADPDELGEENGQSVRVEETFRLKQLPKVDDDYASIWWTEHNDRDITSRLREYNANMQVMDDLSAGRLKIDGVDGADLVRQIKRYVRNDFRHHEMETIDHSNPYHKALFAHLVKRYLAQLRTGVFEGSAGRTQTRPEVAQAIEDHLAELYEKELITEGKDSENAVHS